jgi:hypothetical protein
MDTEFANQELVHKDGQANVDDTGRPCKDWQPSPDTACNLNAVRATGTCSACSEIAPRLRVGRLVQAMKVAARKEKKKQRSKGGGGGTVTLKVTACQYHGSMVSTGKNVINRMISACP